MRSAREGEGDASIHLVLGLLSFRKALLASLAPIHAAHIGRTRDEAAQGVEPPRALPDLLR